ncbi:MAG: hypothetical protein ACYTFK_05935 [Planctomycetota bacterium]|jgi:excinuclease UvrABC nuclease subunit
MLDELFDDCLPIDPATQTAEDLKPLPRYSGKPIQLLTAVNIRRTVAHRLFPQDLQTVKKRANISLITRKIYYCRCYNDFASALKHYRIAKSVYQATYREQLTLPRQSYVKIDPSAKWPFFSVADKPVSGGEQEVFGLFPSRKAANEFVQILQDAFGLCQRPNLPATGRNLTSCPYLQMGACGAVCVGKLSRHEYMAQIADAVSAAAGQIAAITQKLKTRMQESAAARAFEQAQVIKKQLERLELLSGPAYRWTGRLNDLAILHIDRAAKISLEGKRKKARAYSGFFIRAGQITELGDFLVDDFDGFYKTFSGKLTESGDYVVDLEILKEHLSLLAYHLYRSKPKGIWINCSKNRRTPTAEEIKNAITEKIDG